MSTLTDQQKKFYENALDETKSEISALETQIQDELAKIKERLNDLQEAKKVAMEMHSAACKRLGVPNEFEDEEEDDD